MKGFFSGWVIGMGLVVAVTSGATARPTGSQRAALPVDGIENAIPKEYYVGCRPSIGECHFSCPDRRGIAREEPQRCNPQSVYDRWACYCVFNGET